MQACKQDKLAAYLHVVCDFINLILTENGYKLSPNIRSTPSASENRRKGNHR